MINNLLINSDLYALTFATSNNMKFEMIKSNIDSIPKSKLSFTCFNDQDAIIVDKKFYKQTIDEGLKFLRYNNLEEDVYWFNVNGLEIPCGYYQIAAGTSIIKNNKKMPDEIKKYFEILRDYLETDICYSYDYITKKYIICLKDNNYVRIVLKFNKFVLENGIGPFEKIEVTSRYGKLEQRDYPMLSKRK